MNTLAKYALLISVTFGLAACGGGKDEATETVAEEAPEISMSSVEGSVMYRERMMLPPGVTVEVQLLDVSRADAPADVIGETQMTPEGGPPYAYAIEYDPAAIDSRMRYSMRATISMDDQLLFTSTENIDPFGGNPVDILVMKVATQASNDGPTLEGTTWVLETLAGEPAPLGAGEKPASLTFDAEKMMAGGFAGCNNYTGGYAREGMSQFGAPLSFGQMAVTARACMDGGVLEQAYLQMLPTVTGFRFEEGNLALVTGPEVVATFVAQ